MNRLLIFIIVMFVSLLAVSCSSFSSPNTVENSITFSIDDVNAVGQGQNLSVGGEASLPDGVQLAVSAIRLFQNPAQDSGNFTSNRLGEEAVYTILDRQFASVENNRWQANLSVQQKDTNNTLYESWQSNKALTQNSLEPSTRLVLVLALEPNNFSEDIQTTLLNAPINDGTTKLSYTSEGTAYLKTERVISMPVPDRSAEVSPSQGIDADRLTWNDRGQYTPSLEEGAQPKSIPFFEEDNLKTSPENMLQ